MIRAASILGLCSLLAACHSTPGISPQAVQDPTRLASIKSIYIEDLGKEKDADLIEGSSLVREQITTELARSGRFSVVQSPQEADAVLAGLAGFEKWYHGMEGFYGLEGDLDTHYLGVGHFRLVESKTNQTIWTHEYERGFLKPTQSITSRVAEQVVGKLLRDTARADGSR
jgi:TolB-like protein